MIRPTDERVQLASVADVLDASGPAVFHVRATSVRLVPDGVLVSDGNGSFTASVRQPPRDDASGSHMIATVSGSPTAWRLLSVRTGDEFARWAEGRGRSLDLSVLDKFSAVRAEIAKLDLP